MNLTWFSHEGSGLSKNMVIEYNLSYYICMTCLSLICFKVNAHLKSAEREYILPPLIKNPHRKSHMDNPLFFLSLSHLDHSFTTLHYIYLHISPLSPIIYLLSSLSQLKSVLPLYMKNTTSFNPYILFFSTLFALSNIFKNGLICFTLSCTLHCII